MGRIAYIPLEFSKIEKATEGELLLDNKNDDLYTIDDYKIPVSITKYLHEESNNLNDDMKRLENNSERLRFEIEKEINDAINLGYDIDKMILDCNLNVFWKLDTLKDKYRGAKDLYDEINKTYIRVKNQLDVLLEDYSESVNAVLNRIKGNYDNAKNIYDTNYQKYIMYRNLIVVYEREITQLKQDLKNRMLSLGEGYGEYKGTINANKEILLTLVLRVPYYFSNLYGPFYSYNVKTRDSNGKGPGDFSIGYSYKSGDVPFNPNKLHSGYTSFSNKKHKLKIGDGIWNPVLLPDPKIITEEECKTFFRPEDLVRWYWNDNIKKLSVTGDLDFIDRHGQRAKYFHTVDMVYRRKKSISYTNKLSFKI